MADFTKREIKKTFMKLLEQRPIADITVKDIAAECGINRNSFYYHYRNIPELIEEIIKEEAAAIIKKYPTVDTITDCYDAITEFASSQKRAVMHIYRSVNREVFEQYLMNICKYFVEKFVEGAFDELNSGIVTKEMAVDFYKAACFGLVIDWLEHGMTDAYAKRIRGIVVAKNDLMQEYSGKSRMIL